jgi:hypothetical protein
VPPLAEPLTLTLAMTETLTLVDADADAVAAASTQAMAWPLRLPTSPTRFSPALAVASAALSASWPCVCAARTMFGRLVWIALMSAVTWADALPAHDTVTVGGVHVAWNEAELWQLASQFAFTMQLGGVRVASHVGFVTITLQPPLHVALPEHMTDAPALRVQLPLHVPLHEPLQWPGLPDA